MKKKSESKMKNDLMTDRFQFWIETTFIAKTKKPAIRELQV